MQEDPADPFVQLADWAAKTERKVRAGQRRRWLRLVPAAGVVVLLLVVAVLAIRSLTTGAGGGQPHAKQTTPQRAAPADPFTGTPAAGYPKGAAGITLPAAKAVRGFSAAQVGAALGKVRTAMIAARLDESMLVGHDPARFIAMFAPRQRKRLEQDFAGKDFSTYASWISPAVTLDPGEQPRVSGRVTYASMMDDELRTLRVTTNVVWVYAFSRADRPLVVVHDEIQWDFPSTVNLRPGDHGMWFGAIRAYHALIDCEAVGHGLLAPTPQSRMATPDPLSSEDQDALLRADHSLDIRENC